MRLAHLRKWSLVIFMGNLPDLKVNRGMMTSHDFAPSQTSWAGKREPPDRTFHNFRPLQSADRRIVCSPAMPLDGFWGSKNWGNVRSEKEGEAPKQYAKKKKIFPPPLTMVRCPWVRQRNRRSALPDRVALKPLCVHIYVYVLASERTRERLLSWLKVNRPFDIAHFMPWMRKWLEKKIWLKEREKNYWDNDLDTWRISKKKS